MAHWINYEMRLELEVGTSFMGIVTFFTVSITDVVVQAGEIQVPRVRLIGHESGT